MKPNNGENSLKKSAAALVRSAAEAGVRNAQRLTALTPREIELELMALKQERRLQAEHADFQAWLIGRYVLAALHAPRRYPRRPDAVERRARHMTDDEMKRVFAAMAAEGRENGGC